ncbi:unnamed protein product [Trichobilharzia regenti]|nr:unnamed protein product [Trichobilharzia regenti]
MEKRVCLMDIDIQGVEKLQKTSINPICIFIRPRSFAILEKRLRSRSTESEDRILQRLAVAHQEMQYGISEGKFDAVIVNDNVDKMVQEVVDVLKHDSIHTRVLQTSDLSLGIWDHHEKIISLLVMSNLHLRV